MKNPVDVYVGSRLRERRYIIGLSQTKLGNMVGVTFQQIQKYEIGKNRIGASRLYEFAMILLVPVNYFFDGYKSDLPPVDDSLQKDIRLLLKQFSKIKKPYVRKSVVDLARSLAEAGNA